MSESHSFEKKQAKLNRDHDVIRDRSKELVGMVTRKYERTITTEVAVASLNKLDKLSEAEELSSAHRRGGRLRAQMLRSYEKIVFINLLVFM